MVRNSIGKFRHPCCATLACWALLSLPCFAQTIALKGVVHDTSGAVIVGAAVHAKSAAWEASATTNRDGAFAFFQIPDGSGTIDVTAPGFETNRSEWHSEGGSEIALDLTMKPTSVTQQVVVSAARTEVRLSDVPGSAVLLSTRDVTATPALRIDDALRQVPGFSLFRRSGSRTANASAQGVSLRGLGGSASSRALVMLDGISLVDPFGAWVYWDRIPRVTISSVEVVRGGASNLYGSSALRGVVQLITKQPEAPAFALDGSFGNERTPDLSLWTG